MPVFRILILLLLYAPVCLGQEPVYRHFTSDDGLISNNLYCVFQDSKGYIWAGSSAGVSRFDGREFTNFTTLNGLSDNDIFGMFEDLQGRIWFRTNNGDPCFYFHDTLFNQDNFPLLAGAGSSDYITAYAQDEDGNLWIANIGPGLVRINLETHMVEKITRVDGREIRNVVGFQPNKQGEMEAKSYFGNLSLKTRKWSESNIPEQRAGRIVLAEDGNGYSSVQSNLFPLGSLSPLWKFPTNIIFIGFPNPNELWVGTFDGIFAMEGKSRELRPGGRYLAGQAVSSTIYDREGNLWFSTLSEGLFMATDKDVILLNNLPGFPREEVTCTRKSPQGEIYLGFRGGAWGILENRNSFTEKFPKTGYGEAVNEICFQNNGKILITSDHYTQEYNRQNEKRLYPLGAKVILDGPENGIIWAGNRGIYHVNPDTLIRNQSNSTKDIQPPLFELPTNCALYVPATRKYYFGTTEGLYHSDLDLNIERLDGNPVFRRRIACMALRNSDEIWVGTSGWGIYCLNPDTLVWINPKEGLLGNNCHTLKIDDQKRVWVGTDKGLSQISFPDGLGGRPLIRTFSKEDGLASSKVMDVLTDGHLVLAATESGLIVFEEDRIGKARIAPGLEINTCALDGQKFQPGEKLNTIPPGKHTLSIHLSGISYAHAARLAFRYRLSGQDTSWQITSRNELNFDFLPPGNYTFEARAFIRDSDLQSPLRTIKFRIEAPWYQSWWFFALLSLLASGLGFMAWRSGVLKVDRKKLNNLLVQPEAEKKPVILPREAGKFIFVKVDGLLVKVNLHEILWIKSEGHYIRIQTVGARHLVLSTMQSILEKLGNEGRFIRVHRSYIVALDKIEKVQGNFMTIGREEIPIGGSYKEELVKALGQEPGDRS
ncbi:MAG: LytTR family transcriptional regulator DNA-binding domain-containing protein [Bacteroidia bacterium]|nr:LytTR family transcriptional regulator DNA-binding domain-containing protein [Bacteroidia bacterium]